jgi:phage terminase small subunit
MGKRGPKKTPTAKLEARGSWRAGTRKGEPQPGICDDLKPPEWIKGEALKVWYDLAPKLAKIGVLTEIDKRLLARYCSYWVLWLKALADPARTEIDLDRYANQLGKLERELGLTPSARASLATNVKNDGDNDSGKTKYFKAG